MKIVLEYYVTDNCTYSNKIVETLEYNSLEEAELEFLRLCEEHYDKDGKEPKSYDFIFCGEEYSSYNFFIRHDTKKHYEIKYEGPNFYTLEDWWKKGLGTKTETSSEYHRRIMQSNREFIAKNKKS